MSWYLLLYVMVSTIVCYGVFFVIKFNYPDLIISLTRLTRKVGSHLDFTNTVTVAWWKASLKQHVLDYGINAGWNDNNEYHILSDDAESAGFGKTIPIHRSRPLHALLMTMYGYFFL